VLAAPQRCMECGACQVICPVQAIKVESGVGCAAAMIKAALTGKKEVTSGPECCHQGNYSRAMAVVRCTTPCPA
jgi:MinD superfamily P-loop ATPase